LTSPKARSANASPVAHRRPNAIAAPAFSERQFRNAMGQFATGVAVICAPGPPNRFVGFTANSFNSLSLDPPLVVWSLNRRSASLAAFENAEHYTINILAHDQVDLARRFSRPHTDRFEGVDFKLGKAGAPLINGCVAWFECRHHAQHRVGDHMLFVGEVTTCRRRKDAGLLFHHGRFGTTHPAK
jgi:flavin reductase (DIM6/NTAB) family NADH-FMN oxidoreductase RutF